MVLQKIMPIILAVMLGITSCQIGDSPNKSAVNFDEKAMKNDLLKQMTRDVFYQDSMMRVIRAELDRIDIMYVKMENAETRGAQKNQADAVVNRIKHLNKLLETTRSDLRKSSLENKGLLEMIDRFKRELNVKEEKISELQVKVKDQEKVIEQKEKKIDFLELLNTQQQDEIKKMENEIERMKAIAYTELADLLIQISNEMPEVKGMFTRRTKENVQQMQQKLVKDAFRYYGEASFLGSKYAQTRSNELKKEYNFLQ